ncbi:hypothetical protein JD76_00903 [Micromonospora endolithica]|nr:hypothetical protein JD76_00903 [Micromonospora endolithica]
MVGLAATATGVGVGAVLADRYPAASSAPATSSASSPPPADLALRDEGASVTVNWSDPSGGAVPFMVAGGQAGKTLRVLTTVDPGRTTWTVNGLSSRLDYCFTVVAVYSTDVAATSEQVCTVRDGTAAPG